MRPRNKITSTDKDFFIETFCKQVDSPLTAEADQACESLINQLDQKDFVTFCKQQIEVKAEGDLPNIRTLAHFIFNKKGATASRQAIIDQLDPASLLHILCIQDKSTFTPLHCFLSQEDYKACEALISKLSDELIVLVEHKKTPGLLTLVNVLKITSRGTPIWINADHERACLALISRLPAEVLAEILRRPGSSLNAYSKTVHAHDIFNIENSSVSKALIDRLDPEDLLAICKMGSTPVVNVIFENLFRREVLKKLIARLGSENFFSLSQLRGTAHGLPLASLLRRGQRLDSFRVLTDHLAPEVLSSLLQAPLTIYEDRPTASYLFASDLSSTSLCQDLLAKLLPKDLPAIFLKEALNYKVIHLYFHKQSYPDCRALIAKFPYQDLLSVVNDEKSPLIPYIMSQSGLPLDQKNELKSILESYQLFANPQKSIQETPAAFIAALRRRIALCQEFKASTTELIDVIELALGGCSSSDIETVDTLSLMVSQLYLPAAYLQQRTPVPSTEDEKQSEQKNTDYFDMAIFTLFNVRQLHKAEIDSHQLLLFGEQMVMSLAKSYLKAAEQVTEAKTITAVFIPSRYLIAYSCHEIFIKSLDYFIEVLLRTTVLGSTQQDGSRRTDYDFAQTMLLSFLDLDPTDKDNKKALTQWLKAKQGEAKPLEAKPFEKPDKTQIKGLDEAKSEESEGLAETKIQQPPLIQSKLDELELRVKRLDAVNWRLFTQGLHHYLKQQIPGTGAAENRHQLLRLKFEFEILAGLGKNESAQAVLQSLFNTVSTEAARLKSLSPDSELFSLPQLSDLVELQKIIQGIQEKLVVSQLGAEESLIPPISFS